MALDDWDGDPDARFDADFAQGFVGRTLLVGVTVIDASGAVAERHEVHGVIVQVSARGLDLELRGQGRGRTWRMPPFLAELAAAKPGAYTLKTTGETVSGLDFVFMLTIRSGSRH